MCRSQLDPVHWTSNSGITYFDPKNDTYTRVLYLICAAEMQHFSFNTAGNIVEAWLALGYSKQDCDDMVSLQQRQLAMWLDEVCYAVYSLIRVSGTHGVEPFPWAIQVRRHLNV